MATSSTLSISNARSTLPLSLPVAVSLFLSALTTPSLSLSRSGNDNVRRSQSACALSLSRNALALFRPRSLSAAMSSRLLLYGTDGVSVVFETWRRTVWLFSSQFSVHNIHLTAVHSPVRVCVCFQFLQRNNKQSDLQHHKFILSRNPLSIIHYPLLLLYKQRARPGLVCVCVQARDHLTIPNWPRCLKIADRADR